MGAIAGMARSYRSAPLLLFPLKTSSGLSTRADCPVQRGNFSPKRKTGCPGQAFLVTSSAFGRSDSPEGAKHRIRAHSEAAQELPTRSKSM